MPLEFGPHFAGSHIQGGKQRRGAVTCVVVGTPLGLSWSHRQRRLRAIERLDLALFISAQHQRPFRWVDIQAADVA
jgi:hypothetical protein